MLSIIGCFREKIGIKEIIDNVVKRRKIMEGLLKD